MAHEIATSHAVESAVTESRFARWTLIAISLVFLALILLLPLAAVFVEAFRKGTGAFLEALQDDETFSAIKLTLIVAVISVPLNLVFGVAAAWAIAKFEFKGKAFLTTLIDLPFSVSPVIAGLVFVLLFGANSVLGQWLGAYDIKILFAVPGMVLATIFVTFPFVARELIPLMQEQGSADEEAALSLGAGGFQPAPWVNSVRYRWFRAIFAARRTPCRCRSRSSITTIISPALLRWQRCLRCSPW
jgi:sulfate transport system permease protein